MALSVNNLGFYNIRKTLNLQTLDYQRNIKNNLNQFYVNSRNTSVKMKKVTKAALLFAVIAAFFASCKAHENCPAYGQMNKPKLHRTIYG